jgi:hypothetical protein
MVKLIHLLSLKKMVRFFFLPTYYQGIFSKIDPTVQTLTTRKFKFLSLQIYM